MNIVSSMGIAVRTLRANKLRSSLTMLGIVIGVGAVITMAAVGAGAHARVMEQFESLGANTLLIRPGSVNEGGARLGAGTRPTITEEDALAIQGEVPSVEGAAPYITGRAHVVSANLNWWTAIRGVTSEYFPTRDWDVVAGRTISPGEVEGAWKVAVIGQTVARNLFADQEPVGLMIRIRNVPFTVIGVLDGKGQTTWGEDQDDQVLIPLSTAKRRLLGLNPARGRAVGAILVKVRATELMKAAEQEIRELLRQRHGLHPEQEDDFDLSNLPDEFQAQEASSRVLTMLLATIACVSLVAGGIGIMNIMLVSVSERTREIGLRVAVGARSKDILVQFLLEATTLSLIGGVVGIGLGLAGSYGIAYFADWRVLVQPEAVLVAVGFAGAVGIFSGLYPARKAAGLDPITALRHE
jgi:putative ABC transport system permease protein